MELQKTVGMFVSAVVLLATSSAWRVLALEPNPPVLTITDGVLPGTTVAHSKQFTTSLSASVQNPPQSTTEATIEGPKWKWSGGTPIVKLISEADSYINGLDSRSPPNFGQNEGDYSVPVSCTATYKRTDNMTKEVSEINVVGSKTVTFFIRWPKRVEQFDHEFAVDRDFGQSPWRGVEGRRDIFGSTWRWGHEDIYLLVVLDNQARPMPYAEGEVKEGFLNLTGRTDPRGPSTWPGAVIDDHITYIDDVLRPSTMSAEEWEVFKAPYEVPDGTVRTDFDQPWTYLEPSVAPVPIGSHHVTSYQSYALRTGG